MNLQNVVMLGLQLLVMVKCEIGVLKATNGSVTNSFCIYIFPNSHPLPSTESSAMTLKLEDVYDTWDGCNGGNPPAPESNAVVMINTTNCNILDKVASVDKIGGVGVIIVSPRIPLLKPNESSVRVNIMMTAIGEVSSRRLSSMGKDVRILMYSPVDDGVDYSLLLIWAMAMFTISVGSFWSGKVKYTLSERRKENLSHVSEDTEATKPVKVGQEEEDSLRVSPMAVVIFVAFMSCFLILLYFFYDILVYVIIAMFCLASATGFYQCLEPFLPLIPCANERVRRLRVFSVTCQPQPKQILLALLSVGLTVWWICERKESYAWILQDILGIAFSISMLKVIRLPSLKICTVLMVLLFIYDIFFVFVTPFITKNGQSVMVEVATGGTSDEQLPMVLKVPHFGFDPMVVCHVRYSLLGFGDILVPGMLVSYCLGFDLEVKSRKIYFFSTVIAYGFGLLVTFAALYLMTSAQPALLYLVPCTLLTVVAIAVCRKELRQMWHGNSPETVRDEWRHAGYASSGVTKNENSRTNSEIPGEIASNSDTASDVGEEQSLVR